LVPVCRLPPDVQSRSIGSFRAIAMVSKFDAGLGVILSPSDSWVDFFFMIAHENEQLVNPIEIVPRSGVFETAVVKKRITGER
jgi:hypothetical protein